MILATINYFLGHDMPYDFCILTAHLIEFLIPKYERVSAVS